MKAFSFKPGTVYPWIVVIFLMLLNTSSAIDRTVISLLVKPIRADLGITDTQFSMVTGLAFATMYSIAGLPMGLLIDRGSRRLIMSLGVAGWSIMTTACGLATRFWGLFAFRVGVGIGEATMSPAAYSLIADYFPRSMLGRALSIYGISSALGSGLALLIGAAVIGVISHLALDLPVLGPIKPWQAVFFAVGLPGIVLALLTMVVVKEPPRHTLAAAAAASGDEAATLRAAMRYAWSNRGIYGPLFLGMGLIVMFGYGSNVWYPAFLQRAHGFSLVRAGQFWGLSVLILGILGTITAGSVADWMVAKGRRDGHFVVAMFYGVGNVVCGIGTGLTVSVPWLSLSFAAATGFFCNTIVGVMAAAIQIVTPNRMRGKISALYILTAAFIGYAFGPTAIAASTDYIFHNDAAIGYSIALVAFVFPTLGVLILQRGRMPMIRWCEAHAESFK
jgi:MFS family permease